MKILCTGNPNIKTIATAVRNIFPDADFVHKSNGYDLLTQEGLQKFRSKIKDYDVFINASVIANGVQSTLLKIVREEWTSGHVINIGSTMEFRFFNHIDPQRAESKLALRNLGLDMYSEEFRVTHFIVGGHRDRSPSSEGKMDTAHIANTIKWVLDSREHFHVPIIGVENDFWNKGQPGSGCDWQALKNKGLYDTDS
jgi:hypothetical protein